jgi:hypothetical protein
MLRRAKKIHGFPGGGKQKRSTQRALQTVGVVEGRNKWPRPCVTLSAFTPQYSGEESSAKFLAGYSLRTARIVQELRLRGHRDSDAGARHRAYTPIAHAHLKRITTYNVGKCAPPPSRGPPRPSASRFGWPLPPVFSAACRPSRTPRSKIRAFARQIPCNPRMQTAATKKANPPPRAVNDALRSPPLRAVPQKPRSHAITIGRLHGAQLPILSMAPRSLRQRPFFPLRRLPSHQYSPPPAETPSAKHTSCAFRNRPSYSPLPNSRRWPRRRLPINSQRKRRNSMKRIKAMLFVAVLALGFVGVAHASSSCCDSADCCASCSGCK